MEHIGIDQDRRIVEKVLARNLILDLGGDSPWKSGWIHKDYGNILRHRAFCMDISRDKKPHIVGDIMALPFKDGACDGIICNAVLEHIPYPCRAVREVHRVLKPGGQFFFYVPWMYPYHGGPHDYYRFSTSSIRELFGIFNECRMIARGPGSLRVGLGFLVAYQEPFYSLLNRVIAHPLEALISLLIRFLEKGDNSRAALRLRLYLSPEIAHGYFVYGFK